MVKVTTSIESKKIDSQYIPPLSQTPLPSNVNVKLKVVVYVYDCRAVGLSQ